MVGTHCNQLWLEDLRPGFFTETSPKTLTDAEFLRFAELTNDAHPIHYDQDYVDEKTQFEAPVAHGLLLTSLTALGATPLSRQLEGAMIALMGVEMRFLQPVFAGDTVFARLKVETVTRDIDRGRGLVTFEALLLDPEERKLAKGQHKYLIRSGQAKGK